MIWLTICVFGASLVFAGLALAILWVMYLAVMNLAGVRIQGTLPAFALKAGTVLLYIGLVHDVLCNLLVATVVFLEVPREATVSARLRRLVLGADSWRKRLAVWFASTLLNPFSPGGPHIPLE